jgi:hypothetical protein
MVLHEMQQRESGDLEGGSVARRSLASWQRSEDYGIPLDAVEPVFTGTDDLSTLFFQCGNEVLADLHRTLSGEPVSSRTPSGTSAPTGWVWPLLTGHRRWCAQTSTTR